MSATNFVPIRPVAERTFQEMDEWFQRRRMRLYPSVALAGCLPTLPMDWRAVGDVAGTVACRGSRGRSLTAGTVFEGTRKPLRMWFLAMWFVTQKNGVSALGLQRVLGLGSYETAWTWLHKLRRAMVRPGRTGD